MKPAASALQWNWHSVAKDGNAARLRGFARACRFARCRPGSEGPKANPPRDCFAGRARLNGLVGSVHDAAAVNVRLPALSWVS